MPEIGLALLLLCQLLIIGIVMYRGYRDAPVGTRYRGILLLSRPLPKTANPAKAASLSGSPHRSIRDKRTLPDAANDTAASEAGTTAWLSHPAYPNTGELP